LRVRGGVPSLRKRVLCAELRKSFVRANKPRFRICQFSVQRNHIHLVCEAADATALSRGIQGFKVGVVRRLNNKLGRSGRLWDDRYHAEILRTPRQVRHALSYVLHNHRRHSRRELAPGPDAYSSGHYFDGWREPVATGPPGSDAPVAPARTWLLAVGWRRHGLIGLAEVPGPRA
jgi:REP element-mobilizing transposase RayT